MSEVLDAKIVLVLNRAWRGINQVSVRKALENLFSESNGRPAALAVDMEVAVDENGNEVLVNATPVTWDKWIQLPVRPGDLFIQTAKMKIRAPTVIVAANYDKVPLHVPRLTKQAILERDNYTCQYSGQKLSKHELNIDHIVPRDRGGRDTWENLVASRKDINSMKGNRHNHEVGLKLIRVPKSPMAMPRVIRKEEAKHPSWKHFLDI